MGTIIGFIVGYLLGMRAGDKGWAEFEDSVRTIQSSPEVRDLLAAVASSARQALGQGSRAMGNRAPDRARLRVA